MIPGGSALFKVEHFSASSLLRIVNTGWFYFSATTLPPGSIHRATAESPAKTDIQ